MPPGLQRGATPEAQAAWEKLTPQQREVVKAKVNQVFEEARASAARAKAQAAAGRKTTATGHKTWQDLVKRKKTGREVDSTAFFTNQYGQQRQFSAKEREAI